MSELNGKQIAWFRFPKHQGRELDCAVVGRDGVKSITIEREYSGEYNVDWQDWLIVDLEDENNFRVNLKYVESHAMPEEVDNERL